MFIQDVVNKLDAIIERFDEKAPVGMRFHTPTKQDFLELVKCVKQMAEAIQKDGEELD